MLCRWEDGIVNTVDWRYANKTVPKYQPKVFVAQLARVITLYLAVDLCSCTWHVQHALSLSDVGMVFGAAGCAC